MSDLDECAKRVGTTLREKWRLERLLGVGGMAAVYVGAHKIGRKDAIKILHPEIAGDLELRARFEQEAHAVNRFKHPGAVEIRDIDTTEEGAPFLVMELLEGEPLSQRARRGPIDVREVLRLADELLDVLAAAHKQGIIHRDIKPDNLFILKDGHLKVLDFGIARLARAKKAKTREGLALGTASYMPPEQARGGNIDGRADLFAVGATMFRLISNRRVHEQDSEAEVLAKMATEPAPPLASVAPHAPPEVCRIVDKALAFDRDARYPDAAAMQAEIRAVLGSAPASAHAPVPAPVPVPAPALAPSPRDAPTVALPRSDPRTAVAPNLVYEAPTVSQPPPISQLATAVVPPPVSGQTMPTRASPAPPTPKVIFWMIGSVVALVAIDIVVTVILAFGSRADVAPDTSDAAASASGSSFPEIPTAATASAHAPTIEHSSKPPKKPPKGKPGDPFVE